MSDNTIDYSKPAVYSRPIYSGLRGNITTLRNYIKYRTRINNIVDLYRSFDLKNKDIENKSNEYVVLDIGCGSGEFLSLMSNFLPVDSLKGLELDSRLVLEANSRCNGVEITHGSAELIPFENESIDCITSFHNIEHLYHPTDFIAESYRVLKPDGILLLATPNVAGVPAKMLKDKWHAALAPDHVSLKTPGEWNEAFIAAGFEVISQRSTFLSFIPVLRKSPVELINLIMLVIFNDLPWQKGDSYHAIFKKCK